MKTFFWLVVIVLLVLTFSDHNSIKPYRDKAYDFLVEHVAIAADDQEAALRKTRKQLLQLAEQWGDSQRQYLEYANAIYSSITFVLASSERNKMSNPMAYASFRTILADAKRVASPLQQARLNSMVKPFGDLVTATLTVVSAGTYAAFAEPFKSFLASTFDRSNYENADLSRKDRKFAEENGLKVYEKAESFL